MDKKLLHKYIANKCTSEEIDAIFSWIKKQPDKLQEETLLKSYWDKIEVKDMVLDKHARQRLDKIHHTINLNQSERKSETKIRFLNPKDFRIRQLFTRAAVILLIPILTILVYTQFFQDEFYSRLSSGQKYELVSPAGSRIHFELSDGTKVWLNHESKIIYPQRFTGNTRTVELVGEAYFDVETDKTKPFIVESQGTAVKAIGTSFNVKAYPDDLFFETVLESGKVIILKDAFHKKTEVCKMEPGQHFVLDSETNKYTLKTEKTSKYVSWKEGKLTFEDDHLDQVIKRLSRWYNVDISIKDPELNSLTYTGTFVDETLYQVLEEMLEVVTPISFTVSERHMLPDGTLSEREIIIYKKGGKN